MTSLNNMATCWEDGVESAEKSSDIVRSSTAIGIAIEKCPLCSNSKRSFFCKLCIEQGDFTHSSGRNPHRYAEKLQKLNRLKKERVKLLEKVNEAVTGRVQYDKQESEVIALRENISMLQKALEDSRRRAECEKQNVVTEQSKKNRISMKVKSLLEKKDKVLRYLDQSRQQYSRSVEAEMCFEEELQSIRRARVEELVTSIFPITEVEVKDPHESREDADDDNTGEENKLSLSAVGELTEAQHMSYVHGRWVYTGNPSKTQLCVVSQEAHLPGDGDYSAYSAWYETAQHVTPGPGGGTDVVLRNPANSMCSALAYTTQLSSVLAFYLGVNLPEKLCYSKFCGKKLTPKAFSRAVAKLNTNILYICFTQNVDPEYLNASHTVRNLMACFNQQTGQLGRNGPFEVNAEMMQSVEESLLPYYCFSDDSDQNSSSEDDIDFGQEWEAVPRQLPDTPTRMSETCQSTTQSQAIPHHTLVTTPSPSSAGGLMSSAAASVASLWRAATSTTGLASQSPEKKS
ncbi:beclin 1-associated autophagy-related key regulator-like [Ptychodera flava]|uniref:beclin 1-associated autophagy-related key regulator-like n=1 Tax=Ptychodera flava TaxID=63121 RepID=UPI00396A69EB